MLTHSCGTQGKLLRFSLYSSPSPVKLYHYPASVPSAKLPPQVLTMSKEKTRWQLLSAGFRNGRRQARTGDLYRVRIAL